MNNIKSPVSQADCLHENETASPEVAKLTIAAALKNVRIYGKICAIALLAAFSQPALAQETTDTDTATTEEAAEAIKEQLSEIRTNIKTTRDEIKALEDKGVDNLSDEEAEQLSTLKDDLSTLKTSRKDLKKQRAETTDGVKKEKKKRKDKSKKSKSDKKKKKKSKKEKK